MNGNKKRRSCLICNFASVGKGDLLIWAAKDDAYNYAKIDVRESDNVTIQLARNSGDEYVRSNIFSGLNLSSRYNVAPLPDIEHVGIITSPISSSGTSDPTEPTNTNFAQLAE